MSEYTTPADPSAQPLSYLDVFRVSDGRYCVVVVRNGASSRKSYTAEVQAVVKQAQRAGDLAIQTADRELRELCAHYLIPLI